MRMIRKGYTTIFASMLIGLLIWVICPYTLSAQETPPLQRLTFNLLPPQQVAPRETAFYTHLLINHGNEPITVMLTAESRNSWDVTVTPSMLMIGAGETAQIEISHTAPHIIGNGDEDAVTVDIVGVYEEAAETKIAEITNRTIISATYGFRMAVSPDVIYAQPNEIVYYDVEIVHLGTLADEIDVHVVDVTQPLTATVQGGRGRILPVGDTLTLRLAVDVPEGTIDGTAATITVAATSNYLSGGQYTRQFTVNTRVGNQPPTPTPTVTPWAFPMPDVQAPPTPTPTPFPVSIIARDTSVWDEPYPAVWTLPVTRLKAGDEVMVLFEAFDWIEVSWEAGEGWIPITTVTDEAEFIVEQPIPTAVRHSETVKIGQNGVWFVVVAAVCALVLATKLTTPFGHGIIGGNGTSNPNEQPDNRAKP